MRYTLTFSLVLIFLLTGCRQTHYLSERYIKNNIENHAVDEFSTIKLFSIYQGFSKERNAYIELTAYKYKGNKGLVIGTESYYKSNVTKKGRENSDPTFIELTSDECKAILDNYIELNERIEKENPMKYEDIYHDYTISDNLFISFKKSNGSSKVSYIDLWITGNRYRFSMKDIMPKFVEFLEY